MLQKINGYKNRKKLRIRGYNGEEKENIVYLDIKRKNEKLIWKQRAPVKFHDVEDLLTTRGIERYVISGNGCHEAVENSKKFLFHVYTYLLRPVVRISYEREAYFYKFDPSVRVTFDKNIRSKVHPQIADLYEETDLAHSFDGHFIFEVKFKRLFPEWLSAILNQFGARLQSFTKYEFCIEHYNLADGAGLHSQCRGLRQANV